MLPKGLPAIFVFIINPAIAFAVIGVDDTKIQRLA
jgi:hypothetical protein